MLNQPTSDQAYERLLQNEEYEGYDVSSVTVKTTDKVDYILEYQGMQYKVRKAWMRIQKGFWGEPYELRDSDGKSLGHFFSIKNAKGFIVQANESN